MRATGTERLGLLIADCAAAGVSRQALLLRMDRLPEALSRPHHRRLAEAALAPLLRAARAELFQLSGYRLAVTWRGNAEDALLDVVEDLDHLLADAPDAPAVPDILTLFDLPADGPLLLAALADDIPPEQAPPPAVPLDPASLILLETILARADIARFARREAVWRIDPEGEAALAWERRTLSMADLAADLLPGRNLAGEPWLFRRLTCTLDRRLLALLASPGELANAGPFSVDLNVSSLLGPEFLRFDAALPNALRGHVVLGLNPADIVADAASFCFARAFAKARGYRLMLLDATHALLSVLSAPSLDLDHTLLRWTPDFADNAAGILLECDPRSLVLNCGDSVAARSWAASAGITLLTGSAAGP